MLRKLVMFGIIFVGLLGIGTAVVTYESYQEIEREEVTQPDLDVAQMGSGDTEPIAVPTVEELKSALEAFRQYAAPRFDDELERKLAERIFVEMKLEREVIDVDALEKKAREKARYEKAWLAYAKQEYAVVVSAQEVDAWIEEGPDQNAVESQQNYAKALGVTLYELNHEIYRDQYVKWVVWEKLIPILTEKHDESTQVMLDNNQLISLYDKEVRAYMEDSF